MGWSRLPGRPATHPLSSAAARPQELSKDQYEAGTVEVGFAALGFGESANHTLALQPADRTLTRWLRLRIQLTYDVPALSELQPGYGGGGMVFFLGRLLRTVYQTLKRASGISAIRCQMAVKRGSASMARRIRHSRAAHGDGLAAVEAGAAAVSLPAT